MQLSILLRAHGYGAKLRRGVHPATTALRVATTARGSCTVITAIGEVDIATTTLLADALLHAPAHAPIILDLTDVAFMDCTGLHSILRARDNAAAQHAPFILVPSPKITRLLRLANLQHILRTKPTVPDALTAASTD